MGYKKLNWIEVSWEMDNSQHGDDQLLLIENHNFLGLAVADGIGDCEVGRLCSGALIYHLHKILKLHLSSNVLQSSLSNGSSLETIKNLLNNVVLEATQKTRDEFSLTNLVPDKIDELVNSLIPGIGETSNSISNSIKDRLYKVKGLEALDLTTTLCLAFIFSAKDYSGLATISLGDSKVTIYNPEKGWIKHYELEGISVIPTYVSTQKGVVGKPDIAIRFLQPNEFIILSTDGANIMWTTPSGVPGIPFINLLGKYKNNLENFSEIWIQNLKNHKALLDDATLIVARVICNSPSITSCW